MCNQRKPDGKHERDKLAENFMREFEAQAACPICSGKENRMAREQNVFGSL
jgi:hypothetical protein